MAGENTEAENVSLEMLEPMLNGLGINLEMITDFKESFSRFQKDQKLMTKLVKGAQEANEKGEHENVKTFLTGAVEILDRMKELDSIDL